MHGNVAPHALHLAGRLVAGVTICGILRRLPIVVPVALIRQCELENVARGEGTTPRRGPPEADRGIWNPAGPTGSVRPLHVFDLEHSSPLSLVGGLQLVVQLDQCRLVRDVVPDGVFAARKQIVAVHWAASCSWLRDNPSPRKVSYARR